MDIAVEHTKISRGNQVVVPAKVREKFGLKPDDVVVWTIIGDEVIVKFVKKEKGRLSSLVGRINMGPTSPEEIDETVSSG